MILAICFCLTLTANAQAATLTVTKTADTNDGSCNADCSLREAIAAAGSGSIIEFSTLFNTPQTITLSEAAGFRELAILDKSLNIVGKGANLLTVRRDPAAAALFRIFNINSSISGSIISVNLSGMTIAGGRNTSRGGGIRFDGDQNRLTVADCHVTGNTILVGSVDGGGGIHSTGLLTIVHSTVSNNTATNAGSSNAAGIYSFSTGAFLLMNSTVSGNVATGGSGVGGIYTSVAVITNSTVTDNGAGIAGGILGDLNTIVRGTIIAGNRSNSSVPDTAGAFTSQDFNLVGNAGSVTSFNQLSDQIGTSAAPLNPLLLPLTFNGGATPTHALLVGSPAIDAGSSFGQVTDQRGSVRPIDNPGAPFVPGGDNSDVGAFESPRFAPLTVTKTADTNDGTCDADCSLREAIAAAVRGTEIVFSPLFDTAQTITLSEAAGFQELGIFDKSLSIAGKGANLLTIRRDPAVIPAFRIFRVSSSGDNIRVGLNLSGMTVTGGRSVISGGGIRLDGDQNRLTVTNCYITGNSTINGDGGGIYSVGGLTIVNSTVSNNTLNSNTGNGGGIHNFGSSTFVMTNSTVSGNITGGGVGGILTSKAIITNSTITDNGGNSAGGMLGNTDTTVRGTIIAGNRNNSVVPDVASVFVSQGFNLIGNVGSATGFNQPSDRFGTSAVPLNPLLDALGSYGGATPTHRLQSGSPAIDAGSSFGQTTDQRGSLRPNDFASIPNIADGADIGAFELSLGTTAATVMIFGRVLAPEARGLRGARVTLTDQNGATRTILTGTFGYFRFDDIEAGQTVIVSVASKRYSFQPQIIFVAEDIEDLNFTVLSQVKTFGQ